MSVVSTASKLINNLVPRVSFAFLIDGRCCQCEKKKSSPGNEVRLIHGLRKELSYAALNETRKSCRSCYIVAFFFVISCYIATFLPFLCQSPHFNTGWNYIIYTRLTLSHGVFIRLLLMFFHFDHRSRECCHRQKVESAINLNMFNFVFKHFSSTEQISVWMKD